MNTQNKTAGKTAKKVSVSYSFIEHDFEVNGDTGVVGSFLQGTEATVEDKARSLKKHIEQTFDYVVTLSDCKKAIAKWNKDK